MNSCSDRATDVKVSGRSLALTDMRNPSSCPLNLDVRQIPARALEKLQWLQSGHYDMHYLMKMSTRTNI